MSMPEATGLDEQPSHDEASAEANKLLGQVLSDRYRLESVLGTGGMGAVYRAEHLLMHKRVAIKVLHAEMTKLPEAVQRFGREAMAAGRIEHPNVATAYDFGKLDSGAFFLVMELVDGKSLRQILDVEGALTVERTVHIVRQVLQALARAHNEKIVHRDLKPENVMLVDRDGDPDFVKVLDFGIAKVPVAQGSEQAGVSKAASTAALTQLGMVYGTPEYMAPEQALGQEVDLRADLYALGVMFFEMLVGRRPFVAASPVQILGMVISQPVPAMAEVNASRAVPPAVEDVVRKLMAKMPDDRYADARAALAALDAACPPMLLGGMGTSGSWAAVPGASPSLREPLVVSERGGSWREKLPEPARTWVGDRRVQLGAAVGGAVLLLGLVGVMVSRRPSTDVGASGLVASASASASGSAAAAAASPAVSDEELQAAKGVEGLEALKAKAPTDVRVLRALARAQYEAKKGEAAQATVAELLAVAPDDGLDKTLRAAMVQAALADKKPEALLEFIEQKMGPAGPDLLYDLSTNPRSSPALRKSTTDLLAKLQDRATPALKVVLGLRKSVSVGKQGICSQQAALKQLFADAKDHGDGRALFYLLPMTDSKGCGNWLKKTDCYACVREGLNEAIVAIRGREKG